MKLQNFNAEKTTNIVPSKGKVVIATNIKREREMLDGDGNVIDPKTKQVLIPVDKNQ